MTALGFLADWHRDLVCHVPGVPAQLERTAWHCLSITIVKLGNTSMATTVTSKGQVTIPKSVRDLRGIVPGTAVDFDLTPDGDVVLRNTSQGRSRGRSPRRRFAPLRGVAPVKMSTDEILALTRGD